MGIKAFLYSEIYFTEYIRRSRGENKKKYAIHNWSWIK